MYPGPVRHSGGLNLAAQNFVGAPQYADYGGYHVNLDSSQSPGTAWPAPYAAPLRDDWGAYGQGAPPAAGAVHGLNGGSPAAAMAYSPAEYHHHHPHAHHHAGPSPHCSAGVMQPLNAAAAGAAPEPLSPGGQRRGLCEWMRKPAQPPLSSQGKRGAAGEPRKGAPRRGSGGGPRPSGGAGRGISAQTRSGAAPRRRFLAGHRGGKALLTAAPRSPVRGLRRRAAAEPRGLPVRPVGGSRSSGSGLGRHPEGNSPLFLPPPLRSSTYSHLKDFYNQLQAYKSSAGVAPHLFLTHWPPNPLGTLSATWPPLRGFRVPSVPEMGPGGARASPPNLVSPPSPFPRRPRLPGGGRGRLLPAPLSLVMLIPPQPLFYISPPPFTSATGRCMPPALMYTFRCHCLSFFYLYL